MASSGAFPLSPIALSRSRRVSTRVAATLPVELVLDSGDVVTARSVDIGMGGICAKTGPLLDPDTVRFVRLTLGRHQLDLSATARWSSESIDDLGGLTGFLFGSVDTKSEATLWDFIQERGRELALFLRSCDGLHQIDFQDALELALATRLRTRESTELVYGRAGEEASASIFVLFRGAVVLERAQTHRDKQIISRIKPGEMFGGIPTIAGCVPFERAVAVEDSTILEFVSHSLEYLLSEKPPLGVALLRAASFHWIRRFSETLDRTFAESGPP